MSTTETELDAATDGTDAASAGAGAAHAASSPSGDEDVELVEEELLVEEISIDGMCGVY